MKFKYHMYMEQKSDAGNGGGGPLFENPPATPPPAAPTATPTPPATPPAVSYPQNWKDGLPDDIKNDAMLNAISDIPALAKSFVNAQKMVGAEKFAVPSANSPKEIWDQVYEKLGMPKEVDYKLDLAKEMKIDAEFEKGIVKLAREHGVLPRQAKAMLEHLWKHDEAQAAKDAENYKLSVKKELDALKSEWGDAYANKVAQAKAALREYADPETQKIFRETGLGNNPILIKLLAKAGEGLEEGKIKGEGGGGDSVTPAQAMTEINEIKNNIKHPYYDSSHPEHHAAKEKVRMLYSMAFPPQKSS